VRARQAQRDSSPIRRSVEVNVEKTDACLARVSVSVPTAEFESEVAKGLRNVGGRTRMKGFRPGKVPLPVLEKSFGEEVRRQAAEHFLRQAMRKAVEDEGLEPAANPRVHPDDVQLERGEDFVHSFELVLKPEFELGEYKGCEVDGQAIEVDDDDVDAALADVKRQQSHPEPAGEEGLPKDGMALAKIQIMLGERVLQEREGLRISPAEPIPGLDAETYAEALVGVQDATEVDIPYQFPEEAPVEEVRGKEGICRITVEQPEQIRGKRVLVVEDGPTLTHGEMKIGAGTVAAEREGRMVPPTDEELRGLFGAEDDDALRTTVRERIEEARRDQENSRIETQLLEDLLASHPMELPQPLLDEHAQGRMSQLKSDLVSQGVPEEEADSHVQNQADSAYESAAKSLKALYLIEAISQKEGLEITDEDVRQELGRIAARNNAKLEEVRDYYAKENLFPQLATELLEKKVRHFLREHAQVRIPS